VDESCQNIEQAISLQHLFPQIRSAIGELTPIRWTDLGQG
jgi:hypothetical protein